MTIQAMRWSSRLDFEAEGRLIADRIAALTGPIRLALLGNESVALLPGLLGLGMAPLVVDAEQRSMWLGERHPGVRQFTLADLSNESAGIAATVEVIALPDEATLRWDHELAPVKIVAVPATVSAERLSSWRSDASRNGWGQHVRQGLVTWPGDALDAHGIRLLAFMKGGLRIDRGDQRRQIARAERLTSLIRPNDDVLLATHGDAQYSPILAAGARPSSISVEIHSQGVLTVSSAAELSDVDFIVIDDVNEFASADAAITSLTRRLRRSGRLSISMDFGAGCAPDSVLPALRELMSLHGLVIERAWWQWSDESGVARPLLEFDLNSGAAWEESDATGFTLVASRTRAGEWRTQGDARAPNITAFDRDYADPTIVRSLVSLGLRMESSHLRRDLAHDVLRTATLRSADEGAALCVLCYDWFSSPSRTAADSLLPRVSAYLIGDAANPTALRWQVSLAYVAGLMYQQLGERSGAIARFEYVLDCDVLHFSPLLGTKSVAAALALGWMAHADNDDVRACGYWRHALVEAERLVRTGDWSEVRGSLDSPETFGMPELASVLDEAGRAASALRVMRERPSRSAGLAWQAANASWSSLARQSAWQGAADRAWASKVQEGKDWLEGQYHSLTAKVSELECEIKKVVDVSIERKAERDGAIAAYRLADRSHREKASSTARQLASARESLAGAEAAYQLAHKAYLHAQSSSAEQLRLSERRVERLTHSLAANEAQRGELGLLDVQIQRLLHVFGQQSGGGIGDNVRAIKDLAELMEMAPPRILRFVRALAERRIRSKKSGL